MSTDMTQRAGSTRPEEAPLVHIDDPTPRPRDNPLVKGLVILAMLSVAIVVTAATNDGDSTEVISASELASEPTQSESVSDLTRPIHGEAKGVDPLAGAGDPSGPEIGLQPLQLSSGGAVERLRQQAAAQDTTTTEAPTTTAAPTTAPETTATPTTTTTAPEASSAPAEDTATSAPATSEASSDEAAEGTATSDDTATTPETPAAPETTTTTAAPTTTAAAADGWVDAGHGVAVPPVLLAIRWCESRDNYQAANPSSSARGAYQFLTGSWAAYGHADRYGVNQAHLATNAQQDEAALLTWQRDGTRPWNASRHCWSQRI